MLMVTYLILSLIFNEIIVNSSYPTNLNGLENRSYRRKRKSLNSETRDVLSQAKLITKPKGTETNFVTRVHN